MAKILIVDDNFQNLYLLEVLLKANGFEVAAARDGSEALESALEAPPDLIISDILMPVMDGFSLCRTWKTHERLMHIPFVFYTATYTDPKDEKLALDLGADRFVVKPAKPETIIGMVGELIGEEYKGESKSAKPLGDEMEFSRQYNEVLFNKLEKKMADLEAANKELKVKEEALKKDEEFLDSIIENIPNMLFVKEAETLRFVRFNRAGEELVGRNRRDLIGKTSHDIFPEGQADLFTEKDREVLDTRRPVDIAEQRIETEGPGIRILHTRKIPIVEREGRIRYLLGISEDITERKRAEEKLNQTAEELRKSLAGTIQVISMIVEMRDPYTAGHQRRVSYIARTIAQEMNYSCEMVDSISMAGAIHDIGKMAVPAEILVKPTTLTETEFALVKVHSQSGYGILKDIGLPYPVAEMVLQHHERLDGSGYPKNLKRAQILLEAQILAVADVVEAIASHRPYRPSRGIQVALEEIEKNSGILYDPGVVEVCVKLFREKGFTLDGL